jgi:hypothetical protein
LIRLTHLVSSLKRYFGPLTSAASEHAIDSTFHLDTTLGEYLAQFSEIPGWFTLESMAVWDFLLQLQVHMDVTGDFFEIGVYKGKSAVLGAHYLRPEEWCVLVDINPVHEAQAMIESFRSARNAFICAPSSDVGASAPVRARFGRCRWVHVDGEHSASGVANDLALAARLLNKEGIICVDDFFNFRYPQVTAATYRFLSGREPEFQLLFGGSNKGYICRSAVFPRYDDRIRRYLAPVLGRHDLNVQLNRTSSARDDGFFTISWKEGERSVVGLDHDLDAIPF